MTARRMARELAVIILPQIPKDRTKIEKLEIEDLVGRAVQILIGHARELVEAAAGELNAASRELDEIESEHPDNAMKLENLKPVNLTSEQLRMELSKIDKAVRILSEAIDFPELTLHAGRTRIEVPCSKCKNVSSVVLERNDRFEVRNFLIELVETYIDHKSEIDQFIKIARSKWRVERMVSIDRDILRLACTEAFFMPSIPIKVAINEAVELCHRFGDERAAKLINGILGDLAEEAEYFRQTGEFRAQVSSTGSSLEADVDKGKTEKSGRVH